MNFYKNFECKNLLLLLLTSFACLLFLLGYEIHAREGAYVIFPALGLFVLGGYACYSRHNQTITKSFLFIILGITSAFFYAFCSQFYGEVWTTKNYDPLKPMLQIIIFFMVIYIAKKIDLSFFFRVNSFVLAVLSIVSMIIFLKGDFLFWKHTNLRFSSIFKDPNFAGVCFGFGVLSSFFYVNKKKRSFIFLCCLTGVLLTYSKSAAIATFLSIIVYFFISKGRKTKLVIIGLFTTLLLIVGVLLKFLSNNFELLRVDTGMNKRDIYIQSALQEFSNNAFIGRTLEDVLNITSLWGSNSSLHNTLIESAFFYGVPFVFLLLVVNFIALFEFYRKKKWIYFSLLIYTLISSNSFTFMFGSIGALSIYWAMLIGKAGYEER